MSIQVLSDTELVERYVGGNEESIAVLLDRYQKRVFSSIIIVVRDQHLAEDIFQDTFCKVILTLKKGQYNDTCCARGIRHPVRGSQIQKTNA